MKDAGTDLSDQEEKTRRRLSGEEFFQTSQSPSQWPLAENPAAGRRSVRDPKSFAASRGAHPQGRVADRATRRAERRCAAFSDSVDELVAGLRVDIDGSTAAWRVWQWEQARDCGRDHIWAARVGAQFLFQLTSVIRHGCTRNDRHPRNESQSNAEVTVRERK
jgi:hypothetical protein